MLGREGEPAEAGARRLEDEGGDVAGAERRGDHLGRERGEDQDRLADRAGHPGGQQGRARGAQPGDHRVAPSVEVLRDLGDDVPPGRRPREPEREHGRLGPRRGEAHPVDRGDGGGDPLGPLDLEAAPGAEVSALVELAVDRLDDRGVGVAEEEGAVAHGVVDQLTPVDEPLPRPPGPLDVDRRTVRAGHVGGPPGEHARRPGVEVVVGGHGHRGMRRRWESNPRSGFCRPVPYHLATSP